MAVLWFWVALMACMTVAPVSPTNVVGYMPEWRHEGADFSRLGQHLTHLIFFSLEITPKAHSHEMDIRRSETFQVKLSRTAPINQKSEGCESPASLVSVACECVARAISQR